MRPPISALRLTILLEFLLAAASTEVQLSFPSFSTESQGDFMALGDTAHHATNRSYVVNAGARTPGSRGSCAALVYARTVRIQNGATGRVASFSTSFTFAVTTHGEPWDNMNNTLDGSVLAFVFTANLPKASLQNVIADVGQFGVCRSNRYLLGRFFPVAFAVFFGTDYNPNLNRKPSNNYIGVARNLNYEYDVEAYTHNLCGNDTHCSYFSSGRTFTAWIDFTSSSQRLEVRLASGADPKPLRPLLLLPNFKFPKSNGDEVHPSFWGSCDVHHMEEHEILSWNFFSSGIPESELHILRQYLKSRVWIGVTTGGVLLGTLSALVILWSISSFAKPTISYTAVGLSAGPRVFTFKELRKATANFDEGNLLGRGGSGLVYKGSLQGGILVAVKQINMTESEQAQSLFHAEVTSLSQIRHRNVVRLYGWCQENGRLLLVYEYMSNGTLNDWLYKNGGKKVLSLKVRLSILEGVGAALKYLHKDCLSCILHRDIKSSNVLLNADFKAYAGDFGLSRLMDHHKLDKTTLAVGTFGYMAPELPYTGKATKESDVYSFGILVLEVVCGQHPLDWQNVESEDFVLLFKVWKAHEGRSLFSMADPRMFGACKPSIGSLSLFDGTSPIFPLPSLSLDLNSRSASKPRVDHIDIEVQMAMVESLLQLGLYCCLPDAKARPSIVEVNTLLQRILEIENESCVTAIQIPSLPTIKPLEVHHLLEFPNTLHY